MAKTIRRIDMNIKRTAKTVVIIALLSISSVALATFIHFPIFPAVEGLTTLWVRFSNQEILSICPELPEQ